MKHTDREFEEFWEIEERSVSFDTPDDAAMCKASARRAWHVCESYTFHKCEIAATQTFKMMEKLMQPGKN